MTYTLVHCEKKSIVAAFVMPLILVMTVCGCATVGKQGDIFTYKEARQQLKNERYAETVAYIDRWLAEAPPDADDDDYWRVYFYRGFANYYLKNYEAALADIEEALTLKPNITLLHLLNGNVLFQLARYDASLGAYEEVLGLYDRDDREDVRRTILFKKRDRGNDTFTQAIEAADTKGEKGKSFVYYNMGFIYEKKDDVQRAAECYGRSIAANPDYAPAYYQRGVVYLKERLFEDAYADFDAVVRLLPDDASAYCARAEACRKLGRLREAHEDLVVALRRESSYGRAYYVRALVLQELGFDKEAQDDFQHAEVLGFDARRFEQ